MRKIITTSLAAIVFGAAATPFALTAKQSVKKEVTRQLENGQTVTEQVAADLVTPGETVVYVFDIFNDEDQEVSDLVLAMPVPKEVMLIEGSADRSGASVLYSADGGNTFSAREVLTVQSRAGTSRAATRDDITHIQWKIAGPIAIGGADKVTFKGRLR